MAKKKKGNLNTIEHTYTFKEVTEHNRSQPII